MDELARTLHAAASLLEELGDTHWAAWLRRDATALEQGDKKAVRSFLGAFGGMGSLNDCYALRLSDQCSGDDLPLDEEEGRARPAVLVCRRMEEAWRQARALVKAGKV
jgi:hypothetical protein